MGELTRSGLLYPRLLPSSLIPPEDPDSDARVSRTLRDWCVDVTLFVIALGLAVVFYGSTIQSAVGTVSTNLRVVDLSFGAVACVSLWWRRRSPTGVAVLTALLSIASSAAVPASVVALFGVAVHRRTPVVLVVSGINVASGLLYTVVRPEDLSFLIAAALNVGAVAIVVAWGMFVRARRQLVWTLRERAERAEGEQRILAEQARLAERTRIAREMHDVLAHRISLVALHAGGLQVRPDLGAEQVRETATLLRATAQQALEELRGVIGVLREETGVADAPSAPQPTLRDIARLVEDSRRAGAKIDFELDVSDDVEVPGALGRDAYRIVQEALTNVAKHASGTSATVRVSGSPGTGLHIDVRNRLPLVPVASVLPGSGSGLLGLGERVSLAGGTLEHGPTSGSEFVVDARLTW